MGICVVKMPKEQPEENYASKLQIKLYDWLQNGRIINYWLISICIEKISVAYFTGINFKLDQ